MIKCDRKITEIRKRNYHSNSFGVYNTKKRQAPNSFENGANRCDRHNCRQIEC